MFGALTFLSPWLLGGLIALPVIYWLLRTVPPRPRQIVFPPTRILVGLENREKTPDKTPWWLMLIRLLAAALIIFALAEPVLNPNRASGITGGGPIALVVDNGWAAGSQWAERVRMMEQVISQAESTNRPVIVIGTADPANRQAQIEAPREAQARVKAMAPQPFPPQRGAALEKLSAALKGQSGVSVIWLTDGIDHGAARSAIDKLAGLASSEFVVFETANGKEPLGVAARVEDGGKLKADVLRAGGGTRAGTVLALSARGERLGEAAFSFANGARKASAEIALPLELRNQVSRVALASESSAGAVHLLDARSKWSRVGLLAGTEADENQPLLGPLYYVRRALAPFAELVEPQDANMAIGITEILKRRPSTLVLADVGTIAGDSRNAVAKWVESGGVLVRFAGPRLEEAGDNLLPVPLRSGGRALGGALSWSTPQPLAPFTDDSTFAGLTVPKDVRIRRQVLADPSRLDENVLVWARLQDGTPLVTARKRGDGYIVLFHVTANSNWSDLPLSGLFVEMLRRVSTLSTLASGGGGEPTQTRDGDGVRTTVASANQSVLPPVQVLDGQGALRPPPPTASPIPVAMFAKVTPTLDYPPGYYGPAGRPRALNLITEKTELKPLPSLPAAAQVRAYEDQAATNLKPWLLALGLILLLVDVIAVLLLQSGGGRTSPAARAAGLAGAAVLVAAAALATAVPGSDAYAQSKTTPPPAASQAPKPGDAAAIAATSNVTLGYVLTGDTGTDETSRAGLSGLGKVLTARTAVEPGEPVGVDITKDEVAFYPILYWPVLDSAKPLGSKTLGKIDAYMKQGGMIIFDTRDYGQGMPLGFAQRRSANGETPLQRLIGNLDLPRLEPVPQGHVLTKSFYLLQRFPGRWDGGQLWVEAGGGASSISGRRARRADGVSSILVTANDFASAWALDERNMPIYPVVPGGEQQREMAFRVGVNIVMYALTGNYKADQVHVPALLERLGQ